MEVSLKAAVPMKTDVNDISNVAITNTTESRFLVFEIAGQQYALEIDYVTEIIEMMRITLVPYLPNCIKGIINLRGNVTPVMDVRKRFGMPEKEYDDRTCIVVIDRNNMKLGLIVDEVVEVTTMNGSDAIEAREYVGAQSAAGFVKGVVQFDDVLRLLLDCDKLMELSSLTVN